MSQATLLRNSDEDLVGKFYGEDICVHTLDHASSLSRGCREGET